MIAHGPSLRDPSPEERKASASDGTPHPPQRGTARRICEPSPFRSARAAPCCEAGRTRTLPRSRGGSSPLARPPAAGEGDGSLFNWSLIFAQISFRTRSGTVSLAVSDLQTAITYAALVVPPISRYAAQYGPNQSVVSTSPVPFGADVPAGRYNDPTLRGWVNAIATHEIGRAHV